MRESLNYLACTPLVSDRLCMNYFGHVAVDGILDFQ